ncbi:MAG: hypothetical protein WBB74_04135 [Gaiellaceae bacterium]
MVTIVLLNLLLVAGAIAALAAVCGIPYRFGRAERSAEQGAVHELLIQPERDRQAA